MNGDIVQIVIGTLQGIGASTVFVLALFIGFCVIFGFTKTKKTAGGRASVIKSLDERLTHQPQVYFSPKDPRGPVDQLHSPELVDAAARK
jgi:acid phosphatase family membrane protein YuiD